MTRLRERLDARARAGLLQDVAPEPATPPMPCFLLSPAPSAPALSLEVFREDEPLTGGGTPTEGGDPGTARRAWSCR
ncbi:MAG: hypothetical protein JO250_20505 [Armatimonadetes bacterium]|nr:hypothetical protein [Armatimonadota bacterium]